MEFIEFEASASDDSESETESLIESDEAKPSSFIDDENYDVDYALYNANINFENNSDNENSDTHSFDSNKNDADSDNENDDTNSCNSNTNDTEPDSDDMNFIDDESIDFQFSPSSLSLSSDRSITFQRKRKRVFSDSEDEKVHEIHQLKKKKTMISSDSE